MFTGYYAWTPTKYIVGNGALSRVTFEVNDHDRLVIVGGKYLRENQSIANKIDRIFANFSVVYVYLDCGEPSLDSVKILKNKLMDECVVGAGSMSFIAIGGGGLIDNVKASLFSIASGVEPEVLWMMPEERLKNLEVPRPNLICLPTRPGSGSDFNNATVVSGKAGLKKHWINRSIYPSVSAVDPSLLLDRKALLCALEEGLLDNLSHIVEQLQLNSGPMTFANQIAKACLEANIRLWLTIHSGEVTDQIIQDAFCLCGYTSSGLLNRGVRTYWTIHRYADLLSKAWDIPHVLAISLAFEAALIKDLEARELCAETQIFESVLDSVGMKGCMISHIRLRCIRVIQLSLSDGWLSRNVHSILGSCPLVCAIPSEGELPLTNDTKIADALLSEAIEIIG